LNFAILFHSLSVEYRLLKKRASAPADPSRCKKNDRSLFFPSPQVLSTVFSSDSTGVASAWRCLCPFFTDRKQWNYYSLIPQKSQSPVKGPGMMLYTFK
jgi:hypothetical protein